MKMSESQQTKCYNSLDISMGRSMASNADSPMDGEAENLAGSPIWNLQAGEDILPAKNSISIIKVIIASNEFTLSIYTLSLDLQDLFSFTQSQSIFPKRHNLAYLLLLVRMLGP